MKHNPGLLEDQNIPLLEDEAAGMAFPLDAKYFYDCPLIIIWLGPSGPKFPIPEYQVTLVNLSHMREKYLDDCESIPSLASLWPWWLVGAPWHSRDDAPASAYNLSLPRLTLMLSSFNSHQAAENMHQNI